MFLPDKGQLIMNELHNVCYLSIDQSWSLIQYLVVVVDVMKSLKTLNALAKSQIMDESFPCSGNFTFNLTSAIGFESRRASFY